MTAIALLVLRVVMGSLLVGHGAQKLFGAFGGQGPEATGRGFEQIGIRPGLDWARIAGAAELGGGAMTALGLLSPIGPIVAIAPMVVAWRKKHGDKPIWASKGGAELPLTNIAIALALWMTGPGPVSLDQLLRIRTPWWMTLLVIAGTAAGLGVVLEDDVRTALRAFEVEELPVEVDVENVPAVP